MTTRFIFMGPMWTKRMSLMPKLMLRSEMLVVGVRPRGGLAQQSSELKDPIFWAHYTVKQMNLTARITERKLLASTAELRGASRGAWDRWRSKLPNSFS